MSDADGLSKLARHAEAAGQDVSLGEPEKETAPANGVALAPGQGNPAEPRLSPGGELRLFALREGNLFLLLAVIIGLLSGMLVVCFRIAIDWSRFWLLGSALRPSAPRVILVPSVAGLVVAFLVVRFFPRVRGSGVDQTKAAVYIYDGYIPFRTVLGKFVTCALAIGSGQSSGPEDPSLQIGAGLASALGRGLRLSREKVRLIAPVGAAAGLAAAFNAPISAVLFVIEEVIGRWTAGVLGAIVLAAVSSVVVVRWFLGDEPLFRVPAYRLVHPAELIAYALLGVIGGLASLLFVKFVGGVRPRLKALPRWTRYFQPAIAGLMIGVVGVWFPQVMGAGYESIDQAMHDQYTWKMLAALGALKILATSLSFTSGTPGGMFAPTLFIGAMIGGAVGGIERHFFAGTTGSAGAYALVGMGTLFAGFLRAPMTSVFMVLEVSGNYSIILPVMISNTLAYLISRKYQPTALFDLLSRQDGTDLPSMEEEREAPTPRVEDAMRPTPRIVLRCEDPVSRCLKQVEFSPEESFLVSDGKGRWGRMTKEALRQFSSQGKGESPISLLTMNATLTKLHPDQPLYISLQEIGDEPFLPVVHRADFQKLLGVVTLQDILSAYRADRKPNGGPESPERG